MNNAEFKIINTFGNLYRQTLNLRDEVLRKPLGLCLFDEELNEANDFHIVALANGKLIGCLILTPLNKTTVKMRQVAVKTEARRQGIGAGLVKFSETFAKQNGFTQIIAHSRLVAVDFYKRLNYTCEGSEFTEVGIPHIKMIKSLGA